LIIGGARSGKSHFGQQLAQESGKPVLFVATAEAGDEEMRHRIAEHRRARPPDWNTLEVTTRLGEEIPKNVGEAKVVVVDCITMLLNNIFSQHTSQSGEDFDTPLIEKEITREINGLIECFLRLEPGFVIITNEVGMDLVPPNPMGRIYRDLLGRANQLLAKQCDEVYLMVAGLPVPIKPAR
jgi:adenosylcobinamide kinase/adenosylcobinamide-phosphate guanylyltransferase|tara:strand:+ start:422 stop:967 length:546 start_codon:yes stop_codon:yes gene_type:complete